jgi:hypothetical protein
MREILLDIFKHVKENTFCVGLLELYVGLYRSWRCSSAKLHSVLGQESDTCIPSVSPLFDTN